MSVVPAMIGRARLQRTPAGLRVIIPAFRRAWFFLFVERPITAGFLIWCLWKLWPASLFSAFWITFIVVCVATQLAWRALGQEIVTVDKTALTLRTEIAGFGWTRFYELARVSGLRFDDFRPRPSGYGYLGFDYDSPRPWTETMVRFLDLWFLRSRFNAQDIKRGGSFIPQKPRFAKGLSEAEGRALIRVITEYVGAGASAIAGFRRTDVRLPSGI